MSQPDPPQAPSGPWHPRHLLAYARRDGFEHVIYSGSYGREHVWDSPDWRICVQLNGESAELAVEKRWRNQPRMWNTRIATITVTSCGQLYGHLVACGVLPSPVERAA